MLLVKKTSIIGIFIMLLSCSNDVIIPNDPDLPNDSIVDNPVETAFLNINNSLQTNMVIQQNRSFTIFGTSNPNNTVKVVCSWEGLEKQHRTTTSAEGNWSVTINVPKGNFDTHKITVETLDKKREFTNILIGEVWLCSGQSNMVFTVNNLENSATEIAGADQPYIRLHTVNRIKSDLPVDTFTSKWLTCTKGSIPNFSAVAYYFGKKLLEDLQVPVGLINSSWGATLIEMWSDRNSVINDPAISEQALKRDASYRIGSLYNSMIYPLKNIPIAGVIWYQGEANIYYPYFYSAMLQNMVGSWREIWKHNSPDFPFYIAQVCPYNRTQKMPTYYANPALRFMQTISTDLIKNSGIESNDDIGDIKDIHPKNKLDVGLRLAWLALNKTYGKTRYYNKLTPLYKRFEVQNNKIRVVFKNVGDGLKTRDNLTPTMFEIAGSDKIFHFANATILNDSTVEISNENVVVPIAARLGWSYTNITNLVSSENLPVSVFKTYDWMDSTEEPE